RLGADQGMRLPAGDRGRGGPAVESIDTKTGEQRARGRDVVVGTKLLLQVRELGKEPPDGFAPSVHRQQEINGIAQFLQRKPQAMPLLGAERLEVAAALQRLGVPLGEQAS